MSISRYYKTLSVHSFVKGDSSGPSTYPLSRTFKGLIQAPSNSKSFTNAKGTSDINGILFCGVKETFSQKDMIKDTNGTAYLISGQNSQPNGVSGITPQAGQHAEYALLYANEGLL